MTRRPPLLGRLLVRLLPFGARRQEIEDDLLELFTIRAATHGRGGASRRYLADAISLIWIRPARSADAPRVGFSGAREMKQDLLFAARLFRRQPGLFGVVIAGLAIAIALSAAVFSVINAVEFGSYGIREPESVFRVALSNGPMMHTTGSSSPFRGNWAYADFERLSQSSSSLAVVASIPDRTTFRLAPERGFPEPVDVSAVSANYFSELGFHTELGRGLAAADDQPGSWAVVVGYGFWKNRLGGDSGIVGRTIWLWDRPFTVVGVAAKPHSVPTPFLPPAFWIPLASHTEIWRGSSSAAVDETRRRLQVLTTGSPSADERTRLNVLAADLDAPPPAWNPPVDVFGRVKPGATLAQAEGEARAIAASLADEHFGAQRDPKMTARLSTVSLERLDGGSTATGIIAAALAATVILVVLLSCANVANLLLANAAARRREIATRLAMGASRARIVRQLMTESVVIGVIAGIAGLAMAVEALPVFARLIQLPSVIDGSPDFSVYVIVMFLALGVGLIAGLAPAGFGRRGDLIGPLKVDQLSAPLPLPRARLRSILVAGQAAVSLVLLVLAALLTRSMLHSAAMDLGYDANHLMTVSVGSGPLGRGWSGERRRAYWTAATERARQLPGVASVALVDISPFGATSSALLSNGRRISRNDTSPEYFSTVGIQVLRGRTYSADELRLQAPVAVISARLANEFWGGKNPIGSSLERVWGADDPADGKYRGLLRKPKGTRIIGVVADVVTGLRDYDAPAIYLPMSDKSTANLLVRTVDDPRRVERPIREALEALDPSVRATTTFALDGLRSQLEGPRILALLAVLVGATALGLAVIGLAGVTAFVVEQRTHEISVRRALGASNVDVMRMLLRDSLKPVVVGLGLGFAAAIAGGRVVERLLYGVSGHDPIAIVAAVAVLLAAAAAAVLIPAHRSSRVSPSDLLKLG